MDIIIGFSKRPIMFSRFLRWTERRPYSHCYVRVKNHITGQDLILHAAGMSIHTLTLENFKKHGNMIVKEYRIDVTDKDAVKDMLTFWYSVSGNPYGWLQLFGMGYIKLIDFLYSIVGKSTDIKNPFADGTKTMVCSEFCARVVAETKRVNVDISYAEKGGPSWLDKQLSAAGIPLIQPE